MDLLTLLRILVKRWYVVVPTLTLTLVAGIGLTSGIEPQYEAKGAMLLLVPGGSTTNPLLERSGGVNVTAVALTRLIGDSRNRRAVREIGLSSDYDVTVDQTGAILIVSARAETEEAAIAGVDAIFTLLDQELNNVQQEKGVAEHRMITITVLDTPVFASRQDIAKTRASVAIGILGLAAAVSLALAIESLTSTRKPQELDL